MSIKKRSNTKSAENRVPTQVESEQRIQEFLNKQEIAREFHITTRTVDEWMRRRLIPFTKIGRCVRFHWPSIKQHLTEKATVKAA